MTYIPLSDVRIAELTQKANEVNARIHVLRRILIQQGREWREAIDTACPNTDSSPRYRSTLEVEKLHEPTSSEVVEKDIVLFQKNAYYGHLFDWNVASKWSSEMKLKAANPREVLAIIEQHPAATLYSLFVQNNLLVLAPTQYDYEGVRGVFAVAWCRVEHEGRRPDTFIRKAGLFGIKFWDRGDWSAYCE